MKFWRGWPGCVLATCLLPAPFAAGQDWTRFRGPDGNGLGGAANIPAEWAESDFNWKVELPGVGHASPVVWGDKIFVTCGDEETARRTVLCLNAADGTVVWKREFGSQAYRHHGENSYASATPAVDEDHVYFAWTTPREYRLIALDHAGKDVWSTDLGPYAANHGGGSSPVVIDDVVVLANDQDGPASFLVAVDCKSGQVRWKTPRKSDKFSASTPCVFRPRGGQPQLVFTTIAHGITGVDPRSGAVLWELEDAFDARTVGSPAPAGDVIVATCGEGGGGHWLVAVKPVPGQLKPEVAYKITDAAPYVPTPVAKGDLLFYWSDGGVVTCAKAATGETVWQERVGGSYFGSPVCVGDKLYCVSKKGDVVVVSASEKFELLAKNELGEKSHATPAVSGGRMYVRTYSHLVSVGK